MVTSTLHVWPLEARCVAPVDVAIGKDRRGTSQPILKAAQMVGRPPRGAARLMQGIT